MIQRLRSCQEAADEIGVSGRRLRQLLKEGRVEGARLVGSRWVIPSPVKIAPARRGRPPKTISK